ncbi:hypothetical protein DM01DRAFT_1403772 [Hesseltinella vesiculosa]|uniref:F-BAR domain-containing protein n=1 Tax=Hesseltinella vesiculosa TaxID=101127 RepID=A0A1X2GWR6_9FUNG|nr:hypothetical protein DM01DRAFT_1403772 [Hesseltinella vesiculosa]
MSRFEDQFWENAKTNGVSVLVNRMRQAKKTCENLLVIYEARATFEEQHAAQLSAMAQLVRACEETGQLGVTLDTMEDQWSLLAQEHLDLSESLKTYTIAPLSALVLKQKQLRKELQSTTKQLYNTRQLQVNCVLRARDRYNAECSKANEMMQQTTGKTKELTYRRANNAMKQCQQAYDEAMAELELVTTEWNDRWQYTCQEFEKLEHERLSFLQQNLTSFHSGMTRHGATVNKAYAMMEDQASHIDADDDLDAMVEEFGGHSEMPKAVDYVKLQVLYDKAKVLDLPGPQEPPKPQDQAVPTLDQDQGREETREDTANDADSDKVTQEQQQVPEIHEQQGFMVGRMEFSYQSDYYSDSYTEEDDSEDDLHQDSHSFQQDHAVNAMDICHSLTTSSSAYQVDADLISSASCSPDIDQPMSATFGQLPANQPSTPPNGIQVTNDLYSSPQQKQRRPYRPVASTSPDHHPQPSNPSNDSYPSPPAPSSLKNKMNGPPPLPRHLPPKPVSSAPDPSDSKEETEVSEPSDQRDQEVNGSQHDDLEDMLKQLEQETSVPSLPRKKIRPSTRMRISGVRQRQPISRTAQDLLQDLTNSKSILDSIRQPPASLQQRPLRLQDDDPFATVNSLASNAIALATPSNKPSSSSSSAYRPAIPSVASSHPLPSLQQRRPQNNQRSSTLKDYLENDGSHRLQPSLQMKRRPLPQEPTPHANRIPWKGKGQALQP